MFNWRVTGPGDDLPTRRQFDFSLIGLTFRECAQIDLFRIFFIVLTRKSAPAVFMEFCFLGNGRGQEPEKRGSCYGRMDQAITVFFSSFSFSDGSRHHPPFLFFLSQPASLSHLSSSFPPHSFPPLIILPVFPFPPGSFSSFPLPRMTSRDKGSNFSRVVPISQFPLHSSPPNEFPFYSVCVASTGAQVHERTRVCVCLWPFSLSGIAKKAGKGERLIPPCPFPSSLLPL